MTSTQHITDPLLEEALATIDASDRSAPTVAHSALSYTQQP
jgi:hypothetical protein